MTQPEITVGKMAQHVVISQDVIDDHAGWPHLQDIIQREIAERAALAALPPEEQARILRQRAEEQEAAKLSHTCEHCGCDPEEHGDY